MHLQPISGVSGAAAGLHIPTALDSPKQEEFPIKFFYRERKPANFFGILGIRQGYLGTLRNITFALEPVLHCFLKPIQGYLRANLH